MSAVTTDLVSFVHDMDNLGVPPFRDDRRHWPLACCLRQAAVAGNAAAGAGYIRATRLERLWHLEEQLKFRDREHPKHPKIAAWLAGELEQIGWRA